MIHINTLLFIHLTVAALLIVTILLQKTGTDGLSGIGGGSNMGVVSSRSAAGFLTKTTVILAIIFFVNAIAIANLSSQKRNDVVDQVEQQAPIDDAAPDVTLPIAQ